MLTYRIDDMVCGHCVSAVTRAVHAVDPHAEVAADLAAHLVRVERTDADPARFADAIAAAGYGAVRVEKGADPVAARPGGCCCGGGASRCGG